MTQPFLSRQPTETKGLTGAGPHAVPCQFGLPSDYTGDVEVRIVVHDSVGGALRLGFRAQIWISAGSIVDVPDVLSSKRGASWGAVADPTISIAYGDVVVTFDGILGAVVDATTVASGVQT